MYARLVKDVSADFIEELNNRITQEKPTNLIIEIAEFERSHLFAEGCLVGTLALANRRNIPIYLQMGSVLSQLTAHSVPDKYWKLFLNTLFGVILGQFAAEIQDAASINYATVIRERLWVELQKTGSIINLGNEITAAVIDQTNSPKVSSIFEIDNLSEFTKKFWPILFRPLGLMTQNKKDLESLGEFAFETIRNTWDHGYLDLEDKPISGMRFISVRRLNISGESYYLRRIETGPVPSYLEFLSKHLNSDYITQKPKNLVEITIADSGIGIPAKMAGSIEIYEGDINEEREWLKKALPPTGTSKKRTEHPGAGLGLPKAMEATEHLKGLIVFRTGRTLMYRHYLEESQSGSQHDLYEWTQMPYSLIAGTSISLVFPWLQVDQAAFDFNL